MKCEITRFETKSGNQRQTEITNNTLKKLCKQKKISIIELDYAVKHKRALDLPNKGANQSMQKLTNTGLKYLLLRAHKCPFIPLQYDRHHQDQHPLHHQDEHALQNYKRIEHEDKHRIRNMPQI
jgi:hypothetical protein